MARSTRVRGRAAVTALAAAVLLAGCTGTATLAEVDPPVVEPGYPAYTPPTSTPTPTPTCTGPEPLTGPTGTHPWEPSPGPSKSSPPRTPTPSPSPTREPTPSATPTPTPAPQPTSPSPTPEPTPSPTAPAEPISLTTAAWTATCGAAARPPHPNGFLTLTVDPVVTLGQGGRLSTTALLTSDAERAITPERYFAQAVIVRDGSVVSRPPGGGAGSPLIALEPGATLTIPVEHDLMGDCPTPAPTPAPTPGGGGGAASGGGDAGSDVEDGAPAGASATASGAPNADGPGAELLLPGGSTATIDLTLETAALPAGEYGLVVVVRLQRDGGVVAAGSTTLTIEGTTATG